MFLLQICFSSFFLTLQLNANLQIEQIVNTNYDLVAYLYRFSLAFYPLQISFKVIFLCRNGKKKHVDFSFSCLPLNVKFQHLITPDLIKPLLYILIQGNK